MLIHRGVVPQKVTRSQDGTLERVDQTFYRYVGPNRQPVPYRRSHFRRVKPRERAKGSE